MSKTPLSLLDLKAMNKSCLREMLINKPKVFLQTQTLSFLDNSTPQHILVAPKEGMRARLFLPGQTEVAMFFSWAGAPPQKLLADMNPHQRNLMSIFFCIFFAGNNNVPRCLSQGALSLGLVACEADHQLQRLARFLGTSPRSLQKA